MAQAHALSLSVSLEQNTFFVWVKLAEMVGGKGSYVYLPLGVSSYGSNVMRAAVDELPMSDLMKTTLHLVSRVGDAPTVAEERAALQQADFCVTTLVRADHKGAFFLVDPPAAEGALGRPLVADPPAAEGAPGRPLATPPAADGVFCVSVLLFHV